MVLERFGVAPGVTPVTTIAAGWDPLAGRALPDPPDGNRLLDAHLRVDDLSARMLLAALQQMGAFRRAGEQRSVLGLPTELTVAANHHRLFPTLLDILRDAGFLRRVGDLVIATDLVTDLTGPDLTLEARQLCARHPEVAAHVELLTACIERYPQLLRGEAEATTVMFPSTSASKAGDVYRGDPLSDRLNELVAEAVAAYLDAHDGPVRILEVGAGTGGTTAKVLAMLTGRGDDVTYVFTDISRVFVRHGRQAFGTAHPYVEFRRLDIEADPAEQGFAAGEFGVVVAANVLHATRDLRQTLANVTYLLGGRGRLVLSETTAFTPFATLTFGLLDGWWRATDTTVRIPGSPLADVPTWIGLLRGAGFSRAVALPPARGVDDGELGLHVLVAECQAGPDRSYSDEREGREGT